MHVSSYCKESESKAFMGRLKYQKRKRKKKKVQHLSWKIQKKLLISFLDAILYSRLKIRILLYQNLKRVDFFLKKKTKALKGLFNLRIIFFLLILIFIKISHYFNYMFSINTISICFMDICLTTFQNGWPSTQCI